MSCFTCMIIILVILLSSYTFAHGAEKEQLKVLVEKALSEYDATDSFAAIEYLSSQDDPLLAIQAFRSAMRDSYWKEKDIVATLVFGRAGFHYGVTTAGIVGQDEPEMAKQLRSFAKGFMYDIASFTWPGWDEKEVELTEIQIAEGLQSAKANLRLAIEMNKEPIAMSRAYWVLGAQELAQEQHAKARRAFAEAAGFAALAGSTGDELLSKAFECLAEFLSSNGSQEVMGRLETLVDQLRKQKDGEFFASQVDAAMRVFGHN